jgi:quinol-cytochrome oxidoreductase complex cytochrome b subunit
MNGFGRISIPLTLLLLACSISRISTGKASIHGSLVALALLIGIPSIVNNDAAWWITGYYNYLLPVCAAIYTLSVMLDDRKIKFEIIAIFICVFLFLFRAVGSCLSDCILNNYDYE